MHLPLVLQVLRIAHRRHKAPSLSRDATRQRSVDRNFQFFIIINLAVGGAFDGNPNADTVFPQTMYVDYVRVYSED